MVWDSESQTLRWDILRYPEILESLGWCNSIPQLGWWFRKFDSKHLDEVWTQLLLPLVPSLMICWPSIARLAFGKCKGIRHFWPGKSFVDGESIKNILHNYQVLLLLVLTMSLSIFSCLSVIIHHHYSIGTIGQTQKVMPKSWKPGTMTILEAHNKKASLVWLRITKL